MKNLKKNNKGFSLVELIVVVLIIAIIAVALAPQVIKWVGSARENTEKNQLATIKSAVDTVVADHLSQGDFSIAEDAEVTFTVQGTGSTVTIGSGAGNLSTDLSTALADLKKDTKSYTVTIDDKYTVSVSVTPVTP